VHDQGDIVHGSKAAATSLRIDRSDGHSQDRGALPSGFYQDLALEHKSSGESKPLAQGDQDLGRIYPVTALGIFNGLAGRPEDLEIGKAVGVILIAWNALLRVQA
jgi:hypothetical protein